MGKTKVLIMGAAGRDFHNFNVCYRDNPKFQVVAFTATQIPNIDGRKYPPVLAGKLYPRGIPIYPESELTDLIKRFEVDEVVFAYSDVSHEYVMHKASQVTAAGVSFKLLGAEQTMIKSTRPVIAVCAARTGCGKSQVSRKVVRALIKQGLKVVAVRHPMPYGDLAKQAVQRFAEYTDLDKQECTIEEREEYEPYIEMGLVIYAGVDYGKILKAAEKEADVIVWDGGNNDSSFFKPDLLITVVDPHRPGHEIAYYPGETNVRMADILVVNKVNTAPKEAVKEVLGNVKNVNPKAHVVLSKSLITLSEPKAVAGKKVLVVEDGPTVTHGGMAYGAGYFAAEEYKAKIVDPRPFAAGSIKQTFKKFTHLTNVLPAMGYGEKQIEELERTINRSVCDAVIVGTPIDLAKLIRIKKPAVRVSYDIDDKSGKVLERYIQKIVRNRKKR